MTGLIRALICGLFLIGGCAERRDPLDLAERFDLPRTGPTEMARVVGGYELRNRQVRVVINETTGDVAYWGAAGGEQNLLDERGAIARLEGSDSAPVGYVEKRDEQTWQYLGTDAISKTGWRKVYCLEGSSLLVTFIVENQGNERLASAIALRAHLLDEGTERIEQPDLYQAQTLLGRIILRGYRERPQSGAFDEPEATLLSDLFQLKPNERFSFTTEWRMEPIPTR